ncbi:MAG TPA: hypothetical protein VFJ98_05750 [Mycobacteriales bacterium]|nr:hypothetical protein [Mycobacteriales bacterium]
MYDPLALDRQRQDEENVRRRIARGPVPERTTTTRARSARRLHGMRRRLTAAPTGC